MLTYFWIFWIFSSSVSATLECLESKEILQNGNCFFPIESKLSYQEAQENCQNLGGKLFEPLDLESNDFIYESFYNLFRTDFWIGIRDSFNNFAFGSNPYRPLKFTNWLANEKPKHCIQITQNGKWMEADCQDEKLKSICQKRAKNCIVGFFGSKMCF